MTSYFTGHMQKFLHNYRRNFSLVDLIVELRDARLPYTSGKVWSEKFKKDKVWVVILSKADLAPSAEVEKWLKYFSQHSIKSKAFSKYCPDWDEVFELFRTAAGNFGSSSYSLCHFYNIKRAMVVGIPNCGKSSFINLLSRHSKAKVGKLPGMTRGPQWIDTGRGIKFLDTPGVLLPRCSKETAWKFALVGALDLDKINSIGLIEYLSCNDEISSLIGLAGMEVKDFLLYIANKFGLVAKGGEPEIEKSAKRVIRNLVDGKYGRFILEKVNELNV